MLAKDSFFGLVRVLGYEGRVGVGEIGRSFGIVRLYGFVKFFWISFFR